MAISDSAFYMYRGETRALRLGPFTDLEDNPPANDLTAAELTIVDSLDDPQVVVEDAGTVDILDAATWEVQIVLAPADTEDLAASQGGTVYYWTVKLTDAEGTVRYVPVDDQGDPEPGRIHLVQRAYNPAP